MIADEIMSADGNPMFGARIPQEWKQEFEERAAASGRKPADLAREAFANYLGMEAASGAIIDIQKLAERVDAIEKKFQRLAL